MNLYAYCKDNPIAGDDPTGEDEQYNPTLDPFAVLDQSFSNMSANDWRNDALSNNVTQGVGMVAVLVSYLPIPEDPMSDARYGKLAVDGGEAVADAASPIIDAASQSINKAVQSLQDNIAEHEKKLRQYIENPDAFDNKGFLKNAPSDEIRQKIINGRINHLNNEIQTFKNNIDKLFGG